MSKYHLRRMGIVEKSKWIKLNCTGFYGNRYTQYKINETGSSYFVTVSVDFRDNGGSTGEIKKHFPHKKYTIWKAREWAKYMLKNYPDYVKYETQKGN